MPGLNFLWNRKKFEYEYDSYSLYSEELSYPPTPCEGLRGSASTKKNGLKVDTETYRLPSVRANFNVYRNGLDSDRTSEVSVYSRSEYSGRSIFSANTYSAATSMTNPSTVVDYKEFPSKLPVCLEEEHNPDTFDCNSAAPTRTASDFSYSSTPTVSEKYSNVVSNPVPNQEFGSSVAFQNSKCLTSKDTLSTYENDHEDNQTLDDNAYDRLSEDVYNRLQKYFQENFQRILAADKDRAATFLTNFENATNTANEVSNVSTPSYEEVSTDTSSFYPVDSAISSSDVKFKVLPTFVRKNADAYRQAASTSDKTIEANNNKLPTMEGKFNVLESDIESEISLDETEYTSLYDSLNERNQSILDSITYGGATPIFTPQTATSIMSTYDKWNTCLYDGIHERKQSILDAITEREAMSISNYFNAASTSSAFPAEPVTCFAAMKSDANSMETFASNQVDTSSDPKKLRIITSKDNFSTKNDLEESSALEDSILSSIYQLYAVSELSRAVSRKLLHEKGNFNLQQEDDLNDSPEVKLVTWKRHKLFNSPFPRYKHSVSTFSSEKNEIYLMGGLKEGNSVCDVTWKITPNLGDRNNLQFTSKIVKIPDDDKPPARAGHSSVFYDDTLMIFGGAIDIDSNWFADNNLYLFDICDNECAVASYILNKPHGRYGHTIGVVTMPDSSPRLYLFGGQSDNDVFNDLHYLKLDTLMSPKASWETVEPLDNFKPPPLANHSMCVYKSKFYVFGGVYDNEKVSNDLWCFDAISNEWTQITTSGTIPPPVNEHSACLVEDKMYVYGGNDFSETAYDSLYVLDLHHLLWYRLFEYYDNSIIGPGPRCGHSMTYLPSFKKLIIMGGNRNDYIGNNPDDFKTYEKKMGPKIGTMIYELDLLSVKL